MANFTRKYTVELDLDVKKAPEQLKKITANIAEISNNLGKASDKFTVFKDLIDYLNQIDAKIAQLKTSAPDLFEQIFGASSGNSIDAALKKAIEPITKSPEKIAEALNAVQGKISDLQDRKKRGESVKIGELKDVAAQLKEIYALSGKEAPAYLDFGKGARAGLDNILKLKDALSDFRVEWDNTLARFSGGLTIDGGGVGSGGDGGVAGDSLSEEMRARIDALNQQISQLEDLQKRYKSVVKTFKSGEANGFKDISDKYKTDLSIESVKNLMAEFDRLNEKLKTSDKTSVEYYENLMKISEVVLILKRALADVRADDAKKSLFQGEPSGISGQGHMFSALSAYASVKGNGIVKQILGDENASGIVDILKSTKAEIASIEATANNSGDAVVAQNEKMAQSYANLKSLLEEFIQVRAKTADTSLSTEQLDALIAQEDRLMSGITAFTNNPATQKSIGNILQKLSGKQTELPQTLEKIANLLGIQIPQAANTAGEAVGTPVQAAKQQADALVTSYDALAKKVREYYAADDVGDYDGLDRASNALYSISGLSDEVKDKITVILGSFDSSTSQKAINEIANLLGIKIPESAEKAKDAVGGVAQSGYVVEQSKYIKGMEIELRKLFDTMKLVSNEYNILMSGQSLSLVGGLEKEVSQATELQNILANLAKDTVIKFHNHPDGASSNFNQFDFANAINNYKNGFAQLSGIVSNSDITTLDLAKVKLEDAYKVLDKIKEMAASAGKEGFSISAEKINELFQSINPNYANVAKTWSANQFGDLADFIFQIEQRATSAIPTIDKFKNILTQFDIDPSKYEKLISGFDFSSGNIVDLFNQIAKLDGKTSLLFDQSSITTTDALISKLQEQTAAYEKMRQTAGKTYEQIYNDMQAVVAEISRGGTGENIFKGYQKWFSKGEWLNVSDWLVELQNNQASAAQIANKMAAQFYIDPEKYVAATTGASGSDATTASAQAETGQYELLRQKLEEVTAAINTKTEAFTTEATTVDDVVNQEITALQRLKECLDAIKLVVDDTSNSLQAIVVNETLQSILSAMQGGASLTGLVDPLNNVAVELQKVAGIFEQQQQDTYKSATAVSSARITDSKEYAKIQSIAFGALGDQAVEKEITSVKALENGIVQVNGVLKTAQNEWKSFSVQVTQAGQAEELVISKNKRLTDQANQLATGISSAGNAVATYESKLAQLQQAPDGATQKLQELKTKLGSVTNGSELSAWTKEWNALVASIDAAVQKEHEATKLLAAQGRISDASEYAKIASYAKKSLPMNSYVDKSTISIQDMQALENGIVQVTGVMQSAENEWKTFIVTVDQGYKTVVQSIAINGELTANAKEFSQGWLSAADAVGVAKDKLSGLKTTTAANNGLIQQVEKLEAELANVTTLDQLEAWKKKWAEVVPVIDGVVKKEQEAALATQNMSLKAILKSATKSYGSLNIDPLAESLPEHLEVVDKKYQQLRLSIEQCMRDGTLLSKEQIDALKATAREIETTAKQYGNLAQKKAAVYGTAQVTNAAAKYNNMSQTIASNPEFADSTVVQQLFAQYEAAYNRLIAKQREFANSTTKPTQEQITAFKMLTQQFNEAGRALNAVVVSSQKLAQNSGSPAYGLVGSEFDLTRQADRIAALKQAVDSFTDGKAQIGSFNKEFTTLNYTVDNGNGTFTNFTATLNAAKTAIYATAGETKKTTSAFSSFLTELKGKGRSLLQYLMMMGSFYRIIGQIKQGITYVKEIDTALTELKKVTDETEESYANFLQTMSESAGVIGSTVKDLTTMAAEWSRLGYSMEEAGRLAESTGVLLNVSEFEDATEASEALISTIQAFGYTADDGMHVVDILNEVGNNYAVSSDGLATALQDSASALMEGGNNLEQSVALIAAANKVVSIVPRCHSNMVA